MKKLLKKATVKVVRVTLMAIVVLGTAWGLARIAFKGGAEDAAPHVIDTLIGWDFE